MSQAVEQQPAVGEAVPYRRRRLALAAVLGAEVMDLLDSLVTTVAAPAIRRDLGGTPSLVQWLGAGYTLAMAVGLLTGGRLGDLYGRRRMFVIGALGFTVSSALCGLAQSPETLVASRVLQGLFAAVMIPQGLGIIGEVFPPKERAAAFAVFGPVIGLAMVGGPILGGWLTDADFFGAGWRMIFMVNLLPGALIILVALRVLPASRPGGPEARLDLPGVALASAAALLITFPLVQGRELGWPAWTFACVAASVALFAVFGLHERRRERAGRDPLVLPSLFRKRAFTAGLAAGCVCFAAMVGCNLVFTLYLQAGLGMSPLAAGLTVVPQAVGMAVGGGLASAGLASRLGRALLQIGTAVMLAGVAGLALTLAWAGPAVSGWAFAPALLVAGLGTGLLLAPFFDIVLAVVDPRESGSASGTLTAAQQLGGTLGVAALGTLFFALLDGSAAVSGAAASTAASAGAQAQSFGEAAYGALWLEMGLLAVTFALSYALPRRSGPRAAD